MHEQPWYPAAFHCCAYGQPQHGQAVFYHQLWAHLICVLLTPALHCYCHYIQLHHPPPLRTAAYTNPADHFMDLITVKKPITSTPGCPPVELEDMMPHPDELKAYYKNVQVRMLEGQGRTG